ncbi:HEAT repeat domain-containing protein [Anoxynatronum sibiricum]
MWVTLIVIYLLVLVNGLLVLTTVELKLSDRRRYKKYQQMYQRMLPQLQAYVNNQVQDTKTIMYDGDEMKTQVMLELLQGSVKLDPIQMRQVCEALGYVEGVLRKTKDHALEMKHVKQLGVMRSPKAFEVLMSQIQSEDFEMMYQSCYAISLLPLEDTQVKGYVEKLLAADIMRDRTIEMLNNLSLETSVYWRFLEKAETELERVIFMRVLENRLDAADDEIIHRILAAMEDEACSKEVRIASVVAIGSSKASYVLPRLLERYLKEEAWEVRAAIAKAMHHFSVDESNKLIGLLKQMLYDSSWWVRFNAAEVLARKGLVGIDALVDISLNNQDQHAADLAYYILDANQSVYQTIQKTEVEEVE